MQRQTTASRRVATGPMENQYSWVAAVAWLLPVLAFIGPFGGVADAQEELVVGAGETRELEPGSFDYESVSLGNGAMVVLTGTTILSTKSLVTDGRTEITYQGSDVNRDAKLFEFVVLDGTRMRGLLAIDVSGADGVDGQDGGRGADGEDEHQRWAKVVAPEDGGHGGAGGHGTHGEAGMNVSLSLIRVDERAQISLRSDGGDGGDGGDGKRFRRGRRGGDGGAAGNGGNGGDAGKVDVDLVYREGTSEGRLVELREFLHNNVHAEPGQGGQGGKAGQRGHWGDGGDGGSVSLVPWDVIQVKRGADGSGRAGAFGVDGVPGTGTMPQKDLMSDSEWAERKRQLLERIFPKP